MYSIKIEAQGNIDIHGEPTSITAQTICSRVTFKDVFGKFLYSIECMGFSFTTSEVYDKFMNAYDKDIELNGEEERHYWRELYTLSKEDEENSISLKISIKDESE